MKNEIYKNNSVYACLHNTYSLFLNNFKSLFKSTWITALVFSLLTCIVALFTIPNKSLHDWGLDNPTLSWTIQTFIYLLYIISIIVFTASIFKFIDGDSFKTNIFKTSKISLTFIGYSCIIGLLLFGLKNLCSLILNGSSSTPLTVIVYGFAILIALALSIVAFMPTLYIIPKYIIEKDAKLLMLHRYFITGLHHSGKIFVLYLLMSIIFFLALVIIMIPSFILVIAQTTSQLGALDGDALGMPGYFPVLLFVTLIISYFILSYFIVYFNIVFVYAYGSIEKLEYDKKQLNYETK